MREHQLRQKEKKYIAVNYDDETQKKMREFCDEHGFDISIKYDGEKQDPDKFIFHSTIWYTESEHGFNNGTKERQIEATPKSFALFGENEDILVIEVESDELTKLHEHLKKRYSMEGKWPDYKPHVTICGGWENGLPSTLPDFNLTGNEIVIESQDDDA